jgi:hypothetical protein
VYHSKIRFDAVRCGDAIRSGSVSVLIDQAAEDGPSSDPMRLEVDDGGRGGWCSAVRGQLLPSLMGTMLVVVPHVLG